MLARSPSALKLILIGRMNGITATSTIRLPIMSRIVDSLATRFTVLEVLVAVVVSTVPS